MKRSILWAALLVLALSLTACGGKKEPETTTKQAETTTEKPAETTTETTTEETTTEAEKEVSYVGEYSNEAGSPALEIAEENGKYLVQLSIVKLANFDDGVGEMTPDGLAFTATDPSGNPIKALITLEGEKATVEFTDSKWDLIQTGEGFVFTKTSDTPHIWSPVDNTDDAAYIGSYVNEENTPCLNIAKRDDGNYDILIAITGLCQLDDGIGELTEEGMKFTATDPSEKPIGGLITLTETGATVTFTESTWEYLENGAFFDCEKSSDIPNMN